MIPFKKIVCPSDFSDPSYNALVMANELAQSLEAELFVLHVVSSVPLLYHPAPISMEEYVDFNVVRYQEELLKEAQQTMDRVVEEKISPGVKVHKVVLQGAAADEIVNYAKTAGADLIVISTHVNSLSCISASGKRKRRNVRRAMNLLRSAPRSSPSRGRWAAAGARSAS